MVFWFLVVIPETVIILMVIIMPAGGLLCSKRCWSLLGWSRKDLILPGVQRQKAVGLLKLSGRLLVGSKKAGPWSGFLAPAVREQINVLTDEKAGEITDGEFL